MGECYLCNGTTILILGKQNFVNINVLYTDSITMQFGGDQVAESPSIATVVSTMLCCDLVSILFGDLT